MQFDLANYQLFISLIRFRWTSFALYAIASVMSVSLRLKGMALEEEFFVASIGMGLLITIVTAFLLMLGFKVITQTRREAPWSVLLMLLSVGALRGAVLYFEIYAFGYENKLSLFASMLSSSFYTAIYYAGASLFIELRNRRKNQFQAEFQRATLLRLGIQGYSSTESAKDEYEHTMNTIKNAIKMHLPVDQNQLPNTEQVKKVSAEIREQIQMVIRPLSHRLWIGSMGEIRTSGNSRILIDTLQELSFPSKFILLYQFSVGLFGIGISIGFENGMAKTIAAMMGTCVSIQILNILRDFSIIPWQLRTSIFLISIMFIPITFSELFSSIISIQVYWLAALIISPTLPAVVIITSLVTLVARDRKFALAAVQAVSLKHLNTGSDFSDELSEIQLSGYLHNNLQSELLRIAHKLDSASSEDGQKATGILSELNTTLDRSISDVQAIQRLGMERIKALPQAWEGIAEIVLRFEAERKIPSDKEHFLSGLLEEIITNSIRYGGATKLQISVEDGSELSVNIVHNGTGSISNGNGLGGLWLSQISKGVPSIVKKRGETRIKFKL
jgi:hypothetical protein